MRWLLPLFLVLSSPAWASGPRVLAEPDFRSKIGPGVYPSTWTPPDPPTPHEPGELPPDISLAIIPEDRRTIWNPGIPGGIPQQRQVSDTLNQIPNDGTGDVQAAVQTAIEQAGDRYQATGVIQEVVLPAGTFRFSDTIHLNRSGVVLRGQGAATRLRFDNNTESTYAPAILLGQYLGGYPAVYGPWRLAADGLKGSRRITVEDASGIEVGDILAIDQEDDESYVYRGDAWYGKRQPESDSWGPARREPDAFRSVGSLIEVVAKDGNTLTLRDPLHMNFETAFYAEVWQAAGVRPPLTGTNFLGVEDLYLTGGTIRTVNVSYCWLDNLEVDGNPGTENIGSYTWQGGISGHSVELFHAYRCELKNSFIHHSRSITQGGGAYLVELSGYTSESLIENNIVVFGNKLIVGNMMGGGNVIAYNYVDNARTNSASWQEGAIDLNHLSFTHNALVEGNWTSNMGADTTHGNSGWHVFLRNYAHGQNTTPIYGDYPYTMGFADSSFRRAVGIDGYSREMTVIGNVLRAPYGEAVYQVDHTDGPSLREASVYRIGGAVDGSGDNLDDGTALSLLYRHANWDSATGEVVWDEDNPIREIPVSGYLHEKPGFFGDLPWPWVDPLGATEEERVCLLPARERYLVLNPFPEYPEAQEPEGEDPGGPGGEVPVPDVLRMWTEQEFEGHPSTGNTEPITVGHEFLSHVPGWIESIHFYKAAEAGDVFQGRIYHTWGEIISDTGLVTVAAGEGWRTLDLPEPVPYVPGQNLIAAVHYPQGHEPAGLEGEVLARFNGGPVRSEGDYLIFPQNGTEVNGVTAYNGRFEMGTTMVFPTRFYRGPTSPLDSGMYNYYVDVAINTLDPPTEGPPGDPDAGAGGSGGTGGTGGEGGDPGAGGAGGTGGGEDPDPEEPIILPGSIQFVAYRTDTPSTGASKSLPSLEVTAGNHLIVAVGWQGLSGSGVVNHGFVTEVTDSLGHTYTMHAPPEDTSNWFRLRWFSAPITSSGAVSITAHFSADAPVIEMYAVEVSGLDELIPVQTVTQLAGYGDTHTVAPVEVEAGEHLLLHFSKTWDTGGSFWNYDSWTGGFDFAPGGNLPGPGVIGYAYGTEAGSYASGVTCARTEDWNTILIVLRGSP